MEMASEIQILVFPFPVQGHINPMIQFAKRLSSKKGLKITFVVASSIRKTIQVHPSSSINIEYIHDGFIEGEKKDNLDDNIARFKAAMTKSLRQLLVDNLHNTNNNNNESPLSRPRVVVIYDSVMPWALDVVQGLGLRGAAFFTQSSTVSAVYYHYHEGHFEIPIPESTKLVLPALPPLEVMDLPSFISDAGSYPNLFNFITSQFSNFQRADWVFYNTFDALEPEIVSWMQDQWRIKTIGPTIPSLYLDKRLHNDYGINLFNPSAETCLKWLDTKEKCSVVYASFGSLASLSESKMHELAWGLKDSGNYFLLVVRETEKSKLPSDFVNEASERGLVVSWCPQLEVLSHQSVGCFMTHCGWNSTLEALSLGIPMVAMPQWTDQTTNAKCIADVWKVGVRVQCNEKGSITREEIKNCIKEVMEGENGKEIRKNALRWKELAKAAVDEGGSSDKNTDDLISEILRS